jgi:hypothetical protein
MESSVSFISFKSKPELVGLIGVWTQRLSSKVGPMVKHFLGVFRIPLGKSESVLELGMFGIVVRVHPSWGWNKEES